MSASEYRRPIRIPVCLWMRLLPDLHRRGGNGESGAFMFGRPKDPTRKVLSYVCYDDLDPNAYQGGAIAFHGQGHAALWKHCREQGLEVLCDVHTHPGPYVEQSNIDMRHPMLPIVGHIALIVPNFARTAWWSLRTVGVYEYLGNFQWRTHAPGPRRCVRLSLW